LSGILDEDVDDTLISVNLADDERAARNVENKKKKPGYQAYDDSEFNEYSMVCNVVTCNTSLLCCRVLLLSRICCFGNFRVIAYSKNCEKELQKCRGTIRVQEK